MTHIPTAHEIETYSGLYLDVHDPDPNLIVLEDIARALSHTCRYGGHVSKFFSVAEHAVFVSKRLERKGYNEITQLLGLHHDDAEAYLHDIMRPLKPLLGKPYVEMTQRMDAAISVALGLPALTEKIEAKIKEADDWSIYVEVRHLKASRGRGWRSPGSGKIVNSDQPSRIIIPDYWEGGLKPEKAESKFRKRHAQLMEKIYGSS